jgi:hypothetical protein
VALTAVNVSGDTIGLPVYGNCRLISDDGQTLQADPFRSDWSEEVAPGVPHRGVITFPGRLPEGAALLNFAHVLQLGGSITVRGIQIEAPVDGSALPLPIR